MLLQLWHAFGHDERIGRAKVPKSLGTHDPAFVSERARTQPQRARQSSALFVSVGLPTRRTSVPGAPLVAGLASCRREISSTPSPCHRMVCSNVKTRQSWPTPNPHVSKCLSRCCRLSQVQRNVPDHKHVQRRSRVCSAANIQQHQHIDDAKQPQCADVDINRPYALSQESINSYQDSGFVKLQNVFSTATLEHYRPTMSLEVAKADKTPLEEDSDYQKAFTQVPVNYVNNT